MMMNAQSTIFYFGIYMLFEGAVLLFIPNVFLSLLGFPTTQEIWIRFVGIAFLVLSYYYLRAVKERLRKFFEWTVSVRIIQFFLVVAIVFFYSVNPLIIILSGIELLSGLWTFYALKHDVTKS